MLVGWIYTADASVGDVAGLFEFDTETVDGFNIDDYLSVREGRDGAITMSVTWPDGSAIEGDDLPAHIAQGVAFFEASGKSPSRRLPIEMIQPVSSLLTSSPAMTRCRQTRTGQDLANGAITGQTLAIDGGLTAGFPIFFD